MTKAPEIEEVRSEHDDQGELEQDLRALKRDLARPAARASRQQADLELRSVLSYGAGPDDFSRFLAVAGAYAHRFAPSPGEQLLWVAQALRASSVDSDGLGYLRAFPLYDELPSWVADCVREGSVAGALSALAALEILMETGLDWWEAGDHFRRPYEKLRETVLDALKG